MVVIDGTVRAYVVAAIDTRNGLLVEVEVFSEPCPTTWQPRFPVPLFDIAAADYHEAQRIACDAFWTHPMYRWAHRWAGARLLGSRDGRE